MRLIDADALYKKILHLYETDKKATGANAYDLCGMLIEDAPTIEAEPVRHGKWVSIRFPSIYGGCVVECSNCNNRGNRNFEYCQCCGAKMDL